MRKRSRVVVMAVVLTLPLGAGAASFVLAEDVPPAVPTEVRPAQPPSDDGGNGN